MSTQKQMQTVERSDSHKGIYLFAMVIGIAGAAYIYGLAFDDLSEEQLIQYTALWLLPIVFGLYGFVAEKLLRLMEEDDQLTITQATLIWTSALPFVGILLLLPFLIVKGKSALSIALLATLFWVVFLVLFFSVLFPLL